MGVSWQAVESNNIQDNNHVSKHASVNVALKDLIPTFRLEEDLSRSVSSSASSVRSHRKPIIEDTFFPYDWIIDSLEQSQVSIATHVHHLQQVRRNDYDSSQLVFIYDRATFDSIYEGTFMILQKGQYYRDNSGGFHMNMTDKQFRNYLRALIPNFVERGLTIDEESLSFVELPWYSTLEYDNSPHISLFPFEAMNGGYYLI